ncbi:Pentatricopeptide repeat-containing protein At5g08305 [Linum grandiflorum]
MSSQLWRNGGEIQSLISILHSCNTWPQLKQIHALIITLRLSQLDSFVSKILSSPESTNLSYLDYSRRILTNLPFPAPTYGWNALIRSYSSTKLPNRALSSFVQMLRSGTTPDHLTYPFLFKSCSRLFSLKLGFSLHAHITKTGYYSDRFIANSIIHMYASCKDIAHARMVFDEIPVKNRVSWNSMVDGYAKCGEMGLARQVFDLMSERDVVSWSSLIDGYVKANAHLGELEQGREMHQYISHNCLPMTLVLTTSLVDMYSKCGAVEEAFALFRRFPVEQTDVLIWNAMIGGLATHGLVEESLNLFAEMMQTGKIKPDEITYLCLLTACARSGLVKEALNFFECLQKHGMAAKSEHYACMVDMLARSGQVAEAYELVSRMPMEPTASMLGALFNGCISYKRLDLAEIVGRKLIEIQPDNDGRYVGLSNVYAEVRRWDECRNTRAEMERKGVKKTAGYSLVL